MTYASQIGRTGLALLAGALATVPAPAIADIANFQLDGKIYSQWLYANDGTQGCVWLGNPAWVDNITGSNGACTVFSLGIRAQVSKYVKAGARFETRYGATWQNWWENGDIKYEEDAPVGYPGDTSGESLGMNHASYLQLRGFWIEVAPPIKTVKSVLVGSSDLGMFNPWTIGKSRYIDRDNARGIFIQGGLSSAPVKYEAALIALPKLFVGPNWNIGNGDNKLANPFITEDWAYAAKLEVRPSSALRMVGIADYTRDVEFNLEDPDAPGSVNRFGILDNAVDRIPRYQSANTTLEVDVDPLDFLHVNALGALSYSLVNPDYATNGVSDYGGFTPIVFSPGPVLGTAAKVRIDATDPLEIGLSLQAEYFNIGSDYNAIFGSRREADVLLTDGFMEGGQLPTLNLANEFMDWDSAWYESAIGWHGVTLLATQMFGVSQLRGEFTWLGYNTNRQNRDIDFTYPSFLYGDGYTDIDVYDYANTRDRGRDLRAVYRRDQDRQSQIAVLWYDTVIGVGSGIDLKGKLKFIRDRDEHKPDQVFDDYKGNIWTARAQLGYQLTNEMRGFVGNEVNYWTELNRRYTDETFFDYITRKNRLFGGIEYNFGGIKLKYQAEWLMKDFDRFELERDATAFSDLSPFDVFPRPFSTYGNEGHYAIWNRFRTKASLEAAW